MDHEMEDLRQMVKELEARVTTSEKTGILMAKFMAAQSGHGTQMEKILHEQNRTLRKYIRAIQAQPMGFGHGQVQLASPLLGLPPPPPPVAVVAESNTGNASPAVQDQDQQPQEMKSEVKPAPAIAPPVPAENGVKVAMASTSRQAQEIENKIRQALADPVAVTSEEEEEDPLKLDEEGPPPQAAVIDLSSSSSRSIGIATWSSNGHMVGQGPGGFIGMTSVKPHVIGPWLKGDQKGLKRALLLADSHLFKRPLAPACYPAALIKKKKVAAEAEVKQPSTGGTEVGQPVVEQAAAAAVAVAEAPKPKCVACDRIFSSERSVRRHLESLTHKKRIASLGNLVEPGPEPGPERITRSKSRPRH